MFPSSPFCLIAHSFCMVIIMQMRRRGTYANRKKAQIITVLCYIAFVYYSWCIYFVEGRLFVWLPFRVLGTLLT